MDTLEQALQYVFRDKTHLDNALTHSSYANENRTCTSGSNERLEFLGDSVLGMVVAEYLFQTYPTLPEGELTRKRSGLVCERSLVMVAQEWDLGTYLKLGRGEKNSGGHSRPSILADAVEAVLAAVYLDGGLEETRRIIHTFLLNGENTKVIQDYKTALQEIVQRESKKTVTYRLHGSSGPEHAKVFLVDVLLDQVVIGQGKGRSKKEAEQEAARDAMEHQLAPKQC